MGTITATVITKITTTTMAMITPVLIISVKKTYYL